MSKYAVVQFGSSAKIYTYANDLEATIGWERGKARVVGFVDSINFDHNKLKGLSSINDSITTVDVSTTTANQPISVEQIDTKIAVLDQESMDKAGEFISQINARAKVIKAHYEPLKKKAHEAHKAITQQEKDDLAPLEKAVVELKSSINKYMTAGREKVSIEQERLRKEQAEAQEKARLELLKQQRQLELAKQFGDEIEQQEIVEKIETAVDVIIEKPVVVELPKSSTVTYVDTYEVVVKDKSIVPTMFCGVEIRPIDTGLIKKYAKEWVKSGMVVPGIEIIKTQTIRSR